MTPKQITRVPVRLIDFGYQPQTFYFCLPIGYTFGKLQSVSQMLECIGNDRPTCYLIHSVHHNVIAGFVVYSSIFLSYPTIY